MKNNTVYSENEGKLNVANVKLCFENLNSRTYKPGHLVVERQLARESKNSPLRKLAEFANVIVDNCEINESSKNGMTIYVSAVASGEDKMQKLYEWLKTYAGEDKVEELAPGLMESLGIKDSEDNSVASRFAKYRKLYEEESVTEDDKEEEDENDSDNEDNPENDDNGEEGKEKGKEDDKEEEQDELTAIIIEVAKGDEDKAKDELIEAGVDEDDIEILSGEESKDDGKKEDDEQNEDEDETEDAEDSEETVKIKIAVDSFDALKEYLEGKGFDLEEELGGEIVSDEDGETSDDNEPDEENMDDTFAGFDDLFADDSEGEPEEK